MLSLIYRLGVGLYQVLIFFASFFNPKAKAWLQGRRSWKRKWEKFGEQSDQWIWVHCASLGEFEQGRNLIDSIKAQHPSFKILVTFFSPSGYEIRKDYPHADAVAYLPLDTPANARKMVSTLKPAIAIWIKYELWVFTLRELQRQGIPTLLVAARMEADSRFIQGWMSPLYQKTLEGMKHVFCQDQATLQRLRPFLKENQLSVSSDTRYDRVWANRNAFQPRPEIEAFIDNRLCLVGGSVWPKGEAILHQAFDELQAQLDFCMILAPHDIHLDRIQKWEEQYQELTIRYSQLSRRTEKSRILWIDNVGMLAQLYHYADLAYVGGGWGTGLHNILEPAAFGCPILFGPKHRKFPEAQQIIENGGAHDFSTPKEGISLIGDLLHSTPRREDMKKRNIAFVAQRVGATEKVLHWCSTHGLLPNP